MGNFKKTTLFHDPVNLKLIVHVKKSGKIQKVVFKKK